jgi:hypothetical protein
VASGLEVILRAVGGILIILVVIVIMIMIDDGDKFFEFLPDLYLIGRYLLIADMQ